MRSKVFQYLASNRKKAFLGTELKIIEDRGHFPFVEKPDIFFNAISKFMDE